ncbi:MAG: DUF2029 domain-containing protein [Bacteroidota bacterium]|nr:DUF2029 domain-containing protein [Bacteroidota bacterium]
MKSFPFIFLSLSYGLGILSCLYIGNQSDFISIIFPYLISFIVYILILQRTNDLITTYQFIYIGFLCKLLGLFAFPHLSDDVFRFWWDGVLLSHGVNPFSYTPSEALQLEQLQSIIPKLQPVYDHLNSPHYYSIYPSVCQILFVICAFISQGNIFLFSLLLKLIFVLADLGILFFLIQLLRRWRIPVQASLVYFLNPLIVVELHGNLHFELVLIFGLIAALWFWGKNQFLYSGIFFGISVFSKLTSLLFLPYLLVQRFQFKSSLKFIIGAAIISVSFLPFIWNNYEHFFTSLTLYFRQFEFNSMVYAPLESYLFEYKWHEWKSNTGFILSCVYLIIFFILLWYYHFKSLEKNVLKFMWLSLFFYLILSSTVHPWYISPLLLLGVFTFRYTSVLWTLLIMFSYVKYDSQTKMLIPFISAMEYSLLVICLFWEINQNKKAGEKLRLYVLQ